MELDAETGPLLLHPFKPVAYLEQLLACGLFPLTAEENQHCAAGTKVYMHSNRWERYRFFGGEVNPLYAWVVSTNVYNAEFCEPLVSAFIKY